MLQHKHPPRRGVILLTVLIVIVILTLAGYAYNELISSEYRAADTYVRSNEARAAADSGIAYVMGLLTDPNGYTETLDYNPWSNEAVFRDVLVRNDPNARHRTRFSIVSPCFTSQAPVSPDDPLYDGSTPYRFGVQDEAAKLNLNSLMSVANNDTPRLALLLPLQNNSFYTLDNSSTANCILDWMDPNPTEQRSNGAKDQVYQGMNPPYHCKNGPFDTLDELMLVSGVTPQMVYGNDRFLNGTAGTNDGNPANQGWSSFLTVYSHEPNVDYFTNARIWINDTNLQTLNTTLLNLGSVNNNYSSVATNAAQFIMAYRLYGGTAPPTPPAQAAPGAGGAQTQVATGVTPPYNAMSSNDLTLVQTQIANDLSTAASPFTKNQIPSLTALLTSKVTVPVKVPGPGGRGEMTRQITYVSPFTDPNQQPYILPLLYDELTTVNAADLTPRINVNTASYTVLSMLPNLSPQELANIQAAQPVNLTAGNDPTNPIYNTPAWLIVLANLAPSKMASIEPYITARSRVFRFQSLGYCDSGTPVVRIEVVIDTSFGRPRIVYRRDLTELGSGDFDFLPRVQK